MFSVFVNNIPPRVHWRWLKQIFQHHGQVTDVFIPNKRSSSGRKFGFVRFSDVSDANMAVEKLNGAWLLDYRIGVNIARFNIRPPYWKKMDLKKFSESEKDVVTNDLRFRSELHVASDVFEKRSRLDKGESVKHFRRKVCLAEVEEDSLLRLGKCLIGIAIGIFEAEFLMDKFKAEGVAGVSVKKISGKHFLIEFDEDVARLKLLNGDWPWLSEWFSECFPWSDELVMKTRTTWLYCEGVPLHAWNYNTFRNIGDFWGELVSIDEKTLAFEDFAHGAICITTDNLHKIDDVIDLECGGNCFPIRVYEVSSEIHLLSQWCYKFVDKAVSVEEESTGNQNFGSHPEDLISVEEEQSFNGELVDDPKGEGKKGNKSFDSRILGEFSLALEGGERLSPEEVVPETNVSGMRDICLPINDDAQDTREVFSPKDDNVLVGFGSNSENRGRSSIDPVSLNKNLRGRSKSCSTLDLGLNNKRGAKSIVEIEDKIIDDLYKKGRRRGRKKKNIFRDIQKKISVNSIVNASLSDSDFKNRKQVLYDEAKEAWELGKKLGFSATCDDSLVIEELMKIGNKELFCTCPLNGKAFLFIETNSKNAVFRLVKLYCFRNFVELGRVLFRYASVLRFCLRCLVFGGYSGIGAFGMLFGGVRSVGNFNGLVGTGGLGGLLAWWLLP
ncbi:hypothetical protein REPUB_Repub02eG0067400 [Reevesia pubescens]